MTGGLVFTKTGIFILLLIVASVIDIRKREIPNRLCLLITGVAIVGLKISNLLRISIALPLLIAAVISGGIGGGDIKFTAAIGVMMGFWSGMMTTIIGFASMLLFYFVMKVINQKTEDCLPLAPFLSLGCVITILIKGGI